MQQNCYQNNKEPFKLRYLILVIQEVLKLLQDICNWIILFGAVAVAIINILKFFGKPVSFFKKKKDKEYKEMLKKSLDEIIPNYFEQHDLQTRDK